MLEAMNVADIDYWGAFFFVSDLDASNAALDCVNVL